MGDLVKSSNFFSWETDEQLAGLAALAGFATGGLTTALTVGSAGASIVAQRRGAQAQKVELELAQREEATAARDREVQRRRRLAAVLGTQSALAAASGLAMSGSVANVSLTDARRAGEDSAVDNYNTRLRIDALKRNRSSISRMSRFRTATTILGAGERIAARG